MKISGQPLNAALVGESEAMQRIRSLISKIGASDLPVIILGEIGTGKELVARLLHNNSQRSTSPFTVVNCAAMDSTSGRDLLGMWGNRGILKPTGGGTVFFDEVTALPNGMQAQLTRAIQKGTTESKYPHQISLDGRVMSSTCYRLEAAIDKGLLRRELYFRLNVLSITLPPLRERKSDIPLLVEHILRKIQMQNHDREDCWWTLSPEMLDFLLAYDWPGNVRELVNCLEAAVALNPDSSHVLGEVPEIIQSLVSEPISPLREIERREIQRALIAARGDKIAAARMLGIGKTTMYRRLRRYRLSE